MPHIPQKPLRPPPRDEEQNDNRAMNNLARAINALTEWLKANAGSATKADLEASEARIIKAMGERVDPAAIQDLDRVVKANTPKLSGS